MHEGTFRFTYLQTNQPTIHPSIHPSQVNSSQGASNNDNNNHEVITINLNLVFVNLNRLTTIIVKPRATFFFYHG